jgi:hypothetical protein
VLFKGIRILGQIPSLVCSDFIRISKVKGKATKLLDVRPDTTLVCSDLPNLLVLMSMCLGQIPSQVCSDSAIKKGRDGRIYFAVGQIPSLVCSDFAKQTFLRENFRYLLGRLDAAFAGEILTITF